MEFDSFDKHDGVVDYIAHVLRLIEEAESLIGVNGYDWLRQILEAEQKFHKKECEKIIAKMEELHY